jgi:hypothetical protein
MTKVANPEVGSLGISYDELGPHMHEAVDTILFSPEGALVRVDGIGLRAFDCMREMFKETEGEYLPNFYHDDGGHYVRGGIAGLVQERHARISLADHQPDDTNHLWVRVPDPVEESAELRPLKPSKKDFIIGMGLSAASGAVSLLAYKEMVKTGFIGSGNTAADEFELGSGVAATVSILAWTMKRVAQRKA